MTAPDLICYAQALVDENRYLTLGTTSAALSTRSAPPAWERSAPARTAS
jgi:hypothetical protein